MTRSIRPLFLVVPVVLLLGACSTTEPAVPAPTPEPAAPVSPDAPGPGLDTDRAAAADPDAASIASAAPRPDWLGTRILPLAADGFGQRLTTPDELIDRRLMTPRLPDPSPPAPPADGSFRATVGEVTRDVLARSTWQADCPVPLEELRYLTLTFIGFDDRAHTGELLVHADVTDDVVSVFTALHAARFPIEEMRVIARDELDAPPTGDGNVTSAFVCRPTVGGTRWSDHAFGRAIDINPFHNPYVRGDLVIPELAGSYVDRSVVRPGMILPGDAVTDAFAEVGWGWGGDWTGAATDPMHFSVSGR
jgi:hypothetical protein